MRPFWKDVLEGLLLGLVVPGLLLNFAAAMLEDRPSAASVQPGEQTAQPQETAARETQSAYAALPVLVRQEEGAVQAGDMDEYLIGVVLAEMPAWFETEALRAQAVVARTYALKAYTTGGKHGDGSICTRAECCQAYISEEDYLRQGGTRENVDRIRNAVESTSGYVLVYDGTLIEATYFSCSGGSTEDAAAVWGTDYPYLRSVSSPGEEEAAHFVDVQSFTPEEFCRCLGIQATGDPKTWLGQVSYTDGGGVAAMTIGGKQFTGVQLRQLLGLRSTAISMDIREDSIAVTTKGFGHRVGMSQYGADAMAAAGSGYEQILAHYYTGAQILQWENPPKVEKDIAK